MISIGMSTSCVYPLSTESAFRLARDAGFDGIEVMVTNDPVTVVVHPPFRWQAGYARRFEATIRELAGVHGVEFAVENMFPLTLGKVGVRAYSPSSDPVFIDCDAITLDFSHAALGGRDSLEFAMAMGDRLRHVHLTDGTVSMRDGQLLDEHLVPGRGTQPVAEVVRYLASTGWSGSLVAEVNTAGAGSEDGRLAMLRETREFAASQIAAGRRGRRSGVS